MKCYRSTRDFARAVCRENGQSRPMQTYYILQDWQRAARIVEKAPNSYHGVREAIFCVDGRCVTRRFGLWVESASEWDMDWLRERQLREAFDRLRTADLRSPFLVASRNVDPEVERKLNEYLNTARWNLYEEFNRKVLDETQRLMEKDGCFSTLKYRGDLLNQAVA